eukprot:Gb_18775 [translate_table: standard]
MTACFNTFFALRQWAVIATMVGVIVGQDSVCRNVQDGFNCSTRRVCQAYFLYQVKDSWELNNITDVGQLFGGVRESDIANASLVNVSQALVSTQFLIVPLSCSCRGKFYQANVSYTVQYDDTFFTIAKKTFQNLTTCKSIVHANPSTDPYKLKPKTKLLIPLHCSCPNSNQSDKGVQHILTYPIQKDSHLKSVSEFFNVSVEDIKAANELAGDDPAIIAGKSLLVPITNQIELPIPTTASPRLPMSSKSIILSKNVFLILGVLITGSVLILIALYAYHMRWRPRLRQPFSSKDMAETQIENKAKAEVDIDVADLRTSVNLMNISIEEIREATRDFSPECNIEGSVFFCKIRGERMALKRTEEDVSPELKTLSMLHHRNLVKPLGLCKTLQFSYVAYEYVEKGTLAYWLQTGNLSWTDRLRIALDVAAGLEYLHHHTKLKLVHGQINSGNILLDMNLGAKIAKVGEAKFITESYNGGFRKNLVSNHGYEAPEYASDFVVSQELDVFAFGVVLLELLSGKQVVMRGDDGERGETFVWKTIGPMVDGENPKLRLVEWMDPAMESIFPLECALGLAFIAKSCVEENPQLRPNMNDINYNISKLLRRSLWWKSSIGGEIELVAEGEEFEHIHDFERGSTIRIS